MTEEKTPQEWLGELHEQALNTRRQMAKAGSDEDLFVYVQVWRENEPVCALVCRDRDKALAAARLACYGMCADMVGLTFEGWFATSMENPDTGKDWGMGEMAQYMTDHPYNDVISDSINTYVVARSGATFFKCSEMIKSPTNVVFNDLTKRLLESAEDPSDQGEVRGYVPEMLQSFMAMETMDQEHFDAEMIAKVEADLGGHEVRMYHQDRAVVREAAQHQLVIGVLLFAESGSVREKLIDQQLDGKNESGSEIYTGDDFLS